MDRQIATAAGCPAVGVGTARGTGYTAPKGERAMAKSQKKSSKEARKPKKEVKKVIAANPSTKGGAVKA